MGQEDAMATEGTDPGGQLPLFLHAPGPLALGADQQPDAKRRRKVYYGKFQAHAR